MGESCGVKIKIVRITRSYFRLPINYRLDALRRALSIDMDPL